MKTRIFKTGLPIMAFMTAIVFAFATEQKQDLKPELISGWIHQDNQCKVIDTSCENTGGTLCTYSTSSLQVYQDSTCTTPMFRRP